MNRLKEKGMGNETGFFNFFCFVFKKIANVIATKKKKLNGMGMGVCRLNESLSSIIILRY